MTPFSVLTWLCWYAPANTGDRLRRLKVMLHQLSRMVLTLDMTSCPVESESLQCKSTLTVLSDLYNDVRIVNRWSQRHQYYDWPPTGTGHYRLTTDRSLWLLGRLHSTHVTVAETETNEYIILMTRAWRLH